MTDLTIAERLIGGDPDGWKEFFPDYQPTDESRIQKANAIRRGARPEDRSQIVSGNRAKAAYFSTPLSDEDANFVRQKVGVDMGSVREVRGIPIGGSSPPAGIPETSGVSSGETVSEQQSARDPDSNTQNPEPAVGEEGLTREELDEAIEEAITLREAREEAGFVVDETAFDERIADLERRRDSLADDDTGNETAEDFSGDDTRSTVRDGIAVPESFLTEIIPKPNILSEFSSYSYSFSLYLMKPGDYTDMLVEGQRNIRESALLIQTGGITDNTGASGEVAAERNQNFDKDFYIDNFEMESLITGKSTQGAHNATRLSFDIVEPYGISFLDRLANAVSNFQQSDQNLLSQPYLMVIRFYGYDESGNLIQPENKPEETTDSNAAVEKFIPFMWERIKFTVANQSVVYKCKAVAINQYVGLGQIYTSVPYNIEISGQTIEELFGGDKPDFVDNAEDDSATPNNTNKTLHGGIIAALNDFEEIRAKEKGAKPNRYHLVIDEDIKNSRVVHSFETSNLANLPTTERTKNSIAQRIPLNQGAGRKYSIVAGQPLTQVLDLLIRSSTYITNQQIVEITSDPTVDRSRTYGSRVKPDGTLEEGVVKYASNKYQIPRSIDTIIENEPAEEDDNSPPLWYKITTHINFKEYDDRRQEYAYDITYIISKYKVNDLHSEYFPTAKFRGVHKTYDYWFTGKNTEVLNFEQEFNSLFYLTMSPQSIRDNISIGVGNQRNPTAKYTTLDLSDQSEVMETGEAGRPSADAASSLYSPADQGYAELTILGDPAWIQQSELFYNGIENFNFNKFLPDNSINYDAQEPLFQLSFNLPTDYDIEESGIMPVREFNKNKEAEPGSHKFVYRANRVKNIFSGGKFTQQISATLMFDTTERINNQSQESNNFATTPTVVRRTPGVIAGVDLIPDPTITPEDD